MNNTPLGSMAFGLWLESHFEVFWACCLLDTGSIQWSIIATKCPVFVAGDALKGRFIRRHDLFPVINTSVKISQSKLETPIPRM